MKYLIVLSCDFDGPDDVMKAVDHIKPPTIPGFANYMRIVVDPEASVVEKWLDE